VRVRFGGDGGLVAKVAIHVDVGVDVSVDASGSIVGSNGVRAVELAVAVSSEFAGNALLRIGHQTVQVGHRLERSGGAEAGLLSHLPHGRGVEGLDEADVVRTSFREGVVVVLFQSEGGRAGLYFAQAGDDAAGAVLD